MISILDAEAVTAPHSWFATLQAATTSLIAIIALYVAYQQHKTSRDKVRLHLYDKRFAVFAALQELLANVCTDARVDSSALRKFSIATREAEFLFGHEVHVYLEHVYRLAVDYRRLNTELLSGTGTSREGLIEEESRVLRQLMSEFEGSPLWFRTYLQFDQ